MNRNTYKHADRSLSERQALANLNVLLEESDTRDLIDITDLESLLNQVDNPATSSSLPSTSTTLKKKSDMYPPPSTNHEIATFLKLTYRDSKSLDVTTHPQENLNPQ